LFKQLVILLLLPLAVVAQNTIGLPEIINYSKYQYSGGLQNWDIVQDKQGIVYFANNEGLLTFNGISWLLYPLPNKTIVRSVVIGEDGRIYVGGQDEMGFFAPDTRGKLVYTSLIKQISANNRAFGDVWDIVNYKNGVFFRTPSKIFQLLPSGGISVYNAPKEFLYMQASNGKLIVQDFNQGLLYFNNQSWLPLLDSSSIPIPNRDMVTSIVAIDQSTAFISTLKNGLFRLKNRQLEKIYTPNINLFANERIYSAIAISNEWLALATTNGGVFIIDHNGNIIQRFSKTDGLQNNNILSIFLDKEKNLWLGLNNGIDFIAYNSAIKKISYQLTEESGYTALIEKNQLYLGTSNGLYTVQLQPAQDISFSKGKFNLIANTMGQNWGLEKINDRILLGHHEGAFEIKNQTVVPFSNYTGFWNFQPYGSGFIAGNYSGMYLFNEKSQQAIPNFEESSRFVAIDSFNNIWVSHPYHGIYKITPVFNKTSYGKSHGLPSDLNNHVFTIKNQILFATEKGVFKFNQQKNRFEPSLYYQQILGNKSIRYLKADKEGNIWFVHDKNIGVIDFSGTTPRVIDIPELKNKMLSGFEMIYPFDENNIFLGGEKGFYHINYRKYKEITPTITVQVRSVRIGNNLDSLLFGGYFNNPNMPAIQAEENIPEIDYAFKTFRIDYAASQHGYMSNLEYSFRLKGFEKNWSSWTQRTEKEYTNLLPGSYLFEVKARNNLGSESAVARFELIILAPWYMSIWAIILYLFIGVGLVIFLYRLQKKKFTQQKIKYEAEQEKLVYIHELEMNKNESELITLRNEKLEADLSFKNSELASSAMHIVKKGEMLNNIKNELTQITKKIDNEYAVSELKKMIKALNDDEHIDEEWEYFTKHFDKVHSDFIVTLKSIHPSISNNELKLCAYLRMNLSTKEIAQLMNISVRGVEISRYRLRKKLQLATEVNLFDYLIQIGK
jgi:DNA-binding CsgD family transcriptional regulator